MAVVPSVLVLPYHQDERLSGATIVLPDEMRADVVEPDLPEAAQWQRLVTLYDTMADRVADLAGNGELGAVLTGDCLATIGTLTGLQRAGLDPSVVWFDAHGDVHTIASSTSGYLGGMALRMMLGGDADRLAEPLGLRPVSEARAVLVDGRDLDPAEVAYLADSVVRRVTVEDVSPVLLPEGPILVHVDVDVIDAREVPGLRFPVGGGPTSGSTVAAVERLVATGRVAALDIACPWHAPVDDTESTTRKALLASLLATLSTGNTAGSS